MVIINYRAWRGATWQGVYDYFLMIGTWTKPARSLRLQFIYTDNTRPGVGTCKYSTVCDVAGNDGRNTYKCGRDAVGGSEYCELHGHSYPVEGDDDATLRALMDEINSSRPLVGFQLPPISLAGRAFARPLYFEQCTFHGMLSLRNVTMNGTLTFDNCFFVAGADFSHSDFGRSLLFKAVTSDTGACFNFTESTFEDIRLLGSTLAKSDFNLAEFSRAEFINGGFTGDVSIIDAKLVNCRFISYAFEKEVTFASSKFSGCTFVDLLFHAGATFQSSIFDSENKSVINTNMSNVSLLNADISGAKFLDHTQWDDDHRYNIHDVRAFRSDPEAGKFLSTLGVLRSLRDNYEYYLMYRDAGQFFAQEMELRRMFFLRRGTILPHSVLHRIFSLTGLYCWICGYGESFKRVGIWAALLFTTSLAYFTLQTELMLKDGTSYASLDIFEKFGMHLKRTLAAFFPLGGGDLPDYAIRVASVPLLGTMFVVIRRRFERKMRH